MMIPPIIVFEDLKGKSEKEIRKAIRGFKNRIGELKNIIENPFFEIEMSPSYEDQLSMNREYLHYAITALEQAGFSYQPSQKEAKTMLFNTGLDDLKQVEFSMGGFNWQVYYRLAFNETDKAVFEVHSRLQETQVGVGIVSKVECINRLKELYIGEWKRSYWVDACDGTQWELKLTYFNQKAKNYQGSNAFPFSYNDLVCALESWAYEIQAKL